MDEQFTILVFSESRYPVNKKTLKESVARMLREKELKSPVEVSVAIVGDRKMRALHRKYRNEDRTTDVLSFSIMEGKPTPPLPDDILRLGDIVISYPQAVLNAARKEVLVEEEINALVQHGLLHLLGLEG